LNNNTLQVADTGKEPNLLKHRDVKNTILEQAGKKMEPGTVPTFSEFINYVLEETKELKGPRDWKVSEKIRNVILGFILNMVSAILFPE